jgi:hypothetical protein
MWIQVFKNGIWRLKMSEYKNLKKIISIVMVIAFICNIQGGISLHSQELDDLEKQFNKAKQAYIEEKYSESIQRIERITDYIKENKERKDLLGKCHLLLGAIYEKQGDGKKAEENYLIAKNDGIKSIDGIDLENLEIYRKIVKGEEKPTEEKLPKVIEKTKEKSVQAKKKKFPWLLVAGGAVVVTAIILLTKKKKEKQYTLTVNLGEGVEGTPPTGTTTYKEGTTISYNYTLKPGYNNLVVQLDGAALLSSSGTINMTQNHTLTASANANSVAFVTSQDTIQIPEGGTAAFNVRLSAQPTANVNVTVARESGDTDISVISGAALTFTTTNWNTDQTVTLQAAQDTDTTNGQATIAISAPGITQKTITASEQDDDVVNDLTVRIVKPANGTQVTRGTVVDIEASATSSNGIEKVEFYVNNRLIQTDVNTPYTARWDTTGEWEGNYQIIAKAYDNRGNTKSHEVTVTVTSQ